VIKSRRCDRSHSQARVAGRSGGALEPEPKVVRPFCLPCIDVEATKRAPMLIRPINPALGTRASDQLALVKRVKSNLCAGGNFGSVTSRNATSALAQPGPRYRDLTARALSVRSVAWAWTRSPTPVAPSN
jgi:hypothetical protein